ncbi:S41 family peptidase [Aliikangiella sp. IMCC44359]|uniref:S41 family peptidase n=1 Tax=Aliikangiella sp. IMCC44359 TaxID=3459125 RepID=UPI00403AEB6F
MQLNKNIFLSKKQRKQYATLIASSLLVLSCNANTGIDRTQTKLLLQPSLSQNKLAFVYAGDIWVANKDGSTPQRLTSHIADETNPHFSPDGKWIAFTANYNNNSDVYVISSSGGQPKRLTWHPGADIVNDWSPDGKKILFTSRREMKNGRSSQAWEVSVKGGFPTKVMDAVVQSASWSNNGLLAYQPYNTAHRGSSGWRNHRGGSTPPIWILSPKGDSYQEIPHVRASDTNPLWVNDDVYFLSDRDGVRNLYQYQVKSKILKQVTHEKLWDITSADSQGEQIIYSVGGELKILNLQDGQANKVSVLINPDLPERRVQWKDAMSSLESAGLSPSGKRALLSARGEVFTVPLKDGSTRNLTKTDDIRERDALWSPDGEKIAYTSDKGGTQRLVISDQKGLEKTISFKFGKPADYTLRLWGGDGSKIIYTDNHLGLWSINTKTGKRHKIDTNNRRSQVSVSMSPDGRWLAYTKTRANYFADIYLHDLREHQSHRITDGMSHTGDLVFSPDGKYLYFSASTNAGTTAVGLDMSTQERPSRYALYALVLAADGQSPLLPKSDEEIAEEKKDETDDNKSKVAVTIDLKDIQSRIVALPIPQRAYSNLQVAENGSLLYLESEQPGSSLETNGYTSDSSQLIRFDFEKQETTSLINNITNFSLSADGKTLLITSSEGQLMTASVAEKIETKPLETADVKVKVNPANEWAQIFDEVWRTERDYFYAENMHGLNWNSVRERYRKLLPYVGRRADLNYLMVEMIAELEVGHNRVYGGDIPSQDTVNVGLLGADLRVEQNHYKIKKIYTGENWNPTYKAPLAIPGIGVKEGDTIHSVNGKQINGDINIYSLFENTVNQQTIIAVSSDGKLKNARTVTVEPIANERNLRFWNWIETNRKKVDQATKGQVAYVYLPDTADGGFTYFNRMFFAQTDKKALIVDERRNSGGQAANYITDILSRQYLASWKDRDGMVFNTPGGAIYGPKVMLIDQDAGSGGDFLPYSFKRMGLGKLIGKTTWGGLIGIAANRGTIDNGSVLVPFFRFFTPDNEWRVENEGVSPDMDVTLDPVKVNQGKDTQLEAAIADILQQLKTYKPIQLKKAPPLPTQLGQ